jgi:hypothetical protein
VNRKLNKTGRNIKKLLLVFFFGSIAAGLFVAFTDKKPEHGTLQEDENVMYINKADDTSSQIDLRHRCKQASEGIKGLICVVDLEKQ